MDGIHILPIIIDLECELYITGGVIQVGSPDRPGTFPTVFGLRVGRGGSWVISGNACVKKKKS